MRLGKFKTEEQAVNAALATYIQLQKRRKLVATAANLDQTTFDAIDRAEDQIERGQVQKWKDARGQVHARFLGQ